MGLVYKKGIPCWALSLWRILTVSSKYETYIPMNVSKKNARKSEEALVLDGFTRYIRCWQKTGGIYFVWFMWMFKELLFTEGISLRITDLAHLSYLKTAWISFKINKKTRKVSKDIYSTKVEVLYLHIRESSSDFPLLRWFRWGVYAALKNIYIFSMRWQRSLH